MPPQNTLIGQIFIGALILHQIFVVVLLLVRREDRKDHSLAMAVFFGANLQTSIPVFLGYFWPGLPPIVIGNIAFPFVMLLGPAVFFYARALVSPSIVQLQRKDWRHLLPFFISIPTVLLLMIFASNGSIEQGSPAFSQGAVIIYASLSLTLIALFIVATSWYVIRIVRLLARYRRSRFDYFSSLQGRSLTWFEWMIGALTVIWVINVVILLDDTLIGALGFSNDLEAGIEAAWVYVFSLMVLWQPAIFTPRPAKEFDPQDSADQLDDRQSGATKYSRSGLDKERIQRIRQKLDRSMSDEKLYRNHNITLRNLSDITIIPENYISQTLNMELNSNFYDYINSWRVKEACELLIGTSKSIIEIGEDVGFNSRSTFNLAFKKQTGFAPSEYRATQKREQVS
ncbi:AraC family transcriptional regulator [Rhabdaerophilum sp. SD176]|uniref:helix-turn-helix domain-containing protein n=1 Tax=Rhabdaerophilum sp. SD176 TaxID=2983548 RepID=UPI0024DF84E2|nr:AraC family transcriptional regulator [Rhabdaerophilum sp. SD176]